MTTVGIGLRVHTCVPIPFSYIEIDWANRTDTLYVA